MALAETNYRGPGGMAGGLSTRSILVRELDGGFSAHGIRHRRRAQYRRSLRWVMAIWTAVTFRRTANVLLALALLVLLSPLLLALMVLARLSGGGIDKRQRLGRWAIPFCQYQLYFPVEAALHSLRVFRQLPVLYNILRGEMAFVGPRAVSPSETKSEQRAAWKRYDLRPGLLSPWWIRKRANMAYGNEIGLDLEYVETNTMWGDIGLAVRAIPAALFSDSTSNAPSQLKFLGVRIDNLTMAEAAGQIANMAQGNDASQVCFINADCVNIAFTDQEYRATLAKAELVLADGIGVRVAGTILNQNVRENVNGTDMLPYLCRAAEREHLGIYLLGGRPGVAEACAAWMMEQYPELQVSGFRDGYFSSAEEPEVLDAIAASGAHILLVALGAPRQDKWIATHKDKLGAKVSIGVGGLLDFYSGRIPRAPVWMRELGLEWFFRFQQEPRRMWRRYFLGNAVFLYRVIRERTRVRVPGTEGLS